MSSTKRNILFVIRRFTVGGSQVNLLSIINELDKRNYKVCLMSDSGVLIDKLPNTVKWFDFPFVNLRHPNVKFYREIVEIVKKEDIDFVFGIDPVLSVETYLSYFFHRTPVYGIITAQNVPITFTKKWPTIFVNKSRENIYKELFGLHKTYYVKERLDTNRFLFNNDKKSDIIKIGLVSRLNPIKEDSIFSVLDFFDELNTNDNSQKYQFSVYGGGKLLKSLKEKYKKSNIIFHGEVIDVEKSFHELNVVFGMASSIIQGMASNCISVVVGDKGIHGVVTQDNINYLAENHFNLHEKAGMNNTELNNQLTYYLSNLNELSFYEDYVNANYSVVKGINKIETIIAEKYSGDNFVSTLCVIIKFKFSSFFKRFKNN